MARREENPRVTDTMARKWARKIVDMVKRSWDPESSIYQALEKVEEKAELVTTPWPSETIQLGLEDTVDPGIPVELEVTIPQRSEQIEEPAVGGGFFMYPTVEEPAGRLVVKLTFPIDPSKRRGSRHLEVMHRRIREVLKHEFEHAFQHKRGMRRTTHPSFYEAELEIEPRSKLDAMRYYLSHAEIEAYVAGLYLSAKKARVPLREVFEVVLGKIAKRHNLTKKEMALIKDAWVDEAKKRYPRAMLNPKRVAPAKGRARAVELWGKGPFIRFGEWPKDEHSAIHYAYGDERFTHEAGVSVYPAFWDERSKKWGIDCRSQRAECWENAASNYSIFSQGLTEAFLVSGRVVGHGTDDEPLLRDIRITKKLRIGDIHDPESDYPLPKNPSSLVSTCQELWEHYCERPGKKRLRAVADHLETMKSSKSAKVKAERRRCLRVVRLEARDLRMEI